LEEKDDIIKQELEHLFNENDEICVHIKMKPKVESWHFELNLFHGANEHSEKGRIRVDAVTNLTI
jgi:hypothetical protein